MTPLDAGLAVLVMVVWGFNFVAAKWGLVELPPILLMALRFGLTAVLLLPFVRCPRDKLASVFVLSMTLGCLHFSLMFTGLSRVDASVAAIAIQIQVPFSALLAAVFFGDRLGWRRALGMAVAFAGVVLLAGEPRVSSDLAALALIVAGAFVWSVSNIQIKQIGRINGFALNAYLGLFAAPQLLLVSLILEHDQMAALAAADWRALVSIAYMAIAVTIISYALWYKLLRRYPVNVVMPLTLLVPIVGVASGVVFLGDPLTWHTMLGGLATLVGVGIIVVRRPQLSDPEATSKTT